MTDDNWIPQHARLPEGAECRCLVAMTGDGVPCEAYYDGHRFFVDGVDVTRRVTHWQPWPKMPTRSAKGEALVAAKTNWLAAGLSEESFHRALEMERTRQT